MRRIHPQCQQGHTSSRCASLDSRRVLCVFAHGFDFVGWDKLYMQRCLYESSGQSPS